MFKNMKIGGRLSLIFFIIIFIFSLVAYFTLHESRLALQSASFNHLENAREEKKIQLQNFFDERKSDLYVLRDIVTVLQYNTFQKISSIQDNKKLLIENYFAERLHDLGSIATVTTFVQILRESLEAAHNNEKLAIEINKETTSLKSAIKKTSLREAIKKNLQQIQAEYGYDDIFLINKNGDVVSTLKQGIEYGSNIIKSDLKNTPLYTAFQKGLKEITVQDYMPYSPANNQHLAFITAPVFSANKLVGTIIVSLPHTKLNKIIQRRTGMGETGESYLVGKVGNKISYRNDRTVKGQGKFVIGYEKTGTDINKALAGETGLEIKMGSAGRLELGGYAPVNVKGVQWAIITTISLEESAKAQLPNEEKDLFAKYIEQYNYYDLFLIHPDGEIFYAVKKESDYGTNILTGKYNDTKLAETVQKVLASHHVEMSDYAPYSPSNHDPAAFIAIPLLDKNEEVDLVIAVQLGSSSLNNIMQQRAGMGESGEAYLVGSDKLMRSNSHNDPINRSIRASFANPIQGRVDTEASRQALLGNTDIKIIKDYRGTSVLSAYTPISIGNTVWALIVEIDQHEAFKDINNLETWFAIIAFISIMIIIGFVTVFTRNIKKPLQYLVTISQSISKGNLTNEIKVTGSRDEIGQLLNAFSEMQQKLHTITASLQETVYVVSNAAEEISKGNLDLSQRTEEQAASLEETSASMEEMTSTVQQNADNASQATQLAKQARQQAIQGGDIVGKTIHAMNEISNSSKKVSDIISVIDEIAFQTNLLALNAAVEAARAGEQGRGFAVVATEVRNLAQRSAVAAKEIKELIQDSVSKVSEGRELANKSGETLQDIVDVVKKVNVMIDEIAAASQEQSSGIQQVNKVVTQMDDMVQQNASLVEESALASEAMRDQAQKLKEQIKFFNIGRELDFKDKIASFTDKTQALQAKPDNTSKTVKNTRQEHDWEDF